MVQVVVCVDVVEVGFVVVVLLQVVVVVVLVVVVVVVVVDGISSLTLSSLNCKSI